MFANKEEKGKNMMSVCFRSDTLRVHKLLHLLDYTHTHPMKGSPQYFIAFHR